MYFHRFACLIALSASLLAPLGGQAARAADGIKATAVVEKRVPADLLTVTFHVVETMEPEVQNDLLQFEARLRKDIEAIGARTVRVSQIPGNIVQITGQTIVFPAGPPYDRARPIATLVEHGPEGPILNLRVVATVTLAALAN